MNTTFKEMSMSLKIISGSMIKPENKIEKTLQYLMAGVSIAGILTIIDVVLKWIFGEVAWHN